jgi:phosphoglycolate phosphatase-like HAD superfamily hydrolase
MKLSTSEILVVGDFRFDVMAAKAAGACAVLLTNRGQSSWSQAILSRIIGSVTWSTSRQ